MPGNAGSVIQADMLSGIEEESDIYEAFAPHVDYTSISLSTESSPGKPQTSRPSTRRNPFCLLFNNGTFPPVDEPSALNNLNFFKAKS